MPHTTPVAVRRWVASLIISVFVIAVAGAAAIGWWYARESPAHQGPIVLISVDGLPATALPAYGAQRTDTPAIDSLAADAVVFDHAYAHSPQMLPAHATILSGQLPLQHGVRDEAGFALRGDVQTLAEMLRNRGFETGAAVSSFLLRPESGVAQGFRFYDAEFPEAPVEGTPVVARAGADTLDAAENWVRMQGSRRFFLFVEVDQRDADAAVTRLSSLLKTRRLYDGATIMLIGDRGSDATTVLDDSSLRVPLIVKQPDGEGAGRHVDSAVQQIDVVPTILDLVRAPIPGDLRGRSLRAVLTDAEGTVDDQAIYSEWLAAHYRFGGHPIYALTSGGFRLVRGADEDLTPLVTAPAGTTGGAAAETGRLRAVLDRLLAAARPDAREPIAPSDEERFALLGYLAGPRLLMDPEPAAGGQDDAQLVQQHRAAATLIGQKKYSAGIRALQAIADAHPELTIVQYQLGSLLVRTGRVDEGIKAFRAARDRQPEEPDLALALADALMRTGRIDQASEAVEDAVMLSANADPTMRAAAHEMAARVALARKDTDAARQHADAAHAAMPQRPVPQFVRGRTLYDEGKYEDAAAAFQDAIGQLKNGATMADLHLYLGESLAHLERFADAEMQYREELRAFPRNMKAYSSLAMLYSATRRDEAVEDVLNELVSATPTPESYGVAARLWTILGNRSRAEALRSDARARFRGDPSLALLGRDARR